MERVISNGTVFISIDNLENSLCYHVAMLHLLHCSKTLNGLLQTLNIENELFTCVPPCNVNIVELFTYMLKPSILYAQVDENNYKEKFEEIKVAYKQMYTNVIDEYAKNGYSSFYLLYYYYLPILYELFPHRFKSICEEMSIDSIHFNKPMYAIESVLRQAPFLKSKYFDLICKLNEKLKHANINLKHYRAPGVILEVYPNKNSVDGGHALFALRAKNTTMTAENEKKTDNSYFYSSSSSYTSNESLYIFDDATTIDLFKRYTENRHGFIAKISIHTYDETIVNDIQKLWGTNALTKRVNNRFELLAGDNETAMKEISETLVKTIDENEANETSILEPSKMLGGEESASKQGINVFLIATIVLTIILIIDIIFGLTHGCYSKQSFGAPCPCKRH